MKICLICEEAFSDPGALTIDEYSNVERICPDCNSRLNEAIALVIVNSGTMQRTGESVFIGAAAIKKYAPELPPGDHIYIINSNYMRILTKRLIHGKIENF